MDKLMLNQFVSLKLAESIGVNDNLDEWSVEDKEKFVIDNDAKAEWAMGKIREANKEIEAIDEEIERFNMWVEEYRENKSRSAKAKKEKFEHDVSQYVNARMEEDSKYRLKTIYGNVSRRIKPLSWNYDETHAIEYLKANEHTDLITVTEKFNKSEFKKLFSVNDELQAIDENGEIIDFIDVTEQGHTFTFKFTEVDK